MCPRRPFLFLVMLSVVISGCASQTEPDRPAQEKGRQPEEPPKSQTTSTIEYQKGVERLRVNDFEGGIAHLSDAIKEDPKNTRAYLKRASAYAARGKYEKALEDGTVAIRLDPNNPFSFVQRAEAFQALGRLEEAIADFTEAARLDARYAPLLAEARNAVSAVDARREHIVRVTAVIEAWKDLIKLTKPICDDASARRVAPLLKKKIKAAESSEKQLDAMGRFVPTDSETLKLRKELNATRMAAAMEMNRLAFLTTGDWFVNEVLTLYLNIKPEGAR